MLEFKGDGRVIQTLQTLAQEAPTQVASAMYEEWSIALGQMKTRTPFDTGALRRSGQIFPPTIGRTISTRLSFGGGPERVTYALFVHEINKHYRVGGWKYVQSVLNEIRGTIFTRILRRVAFLKAR